MKKIIIDTDPGVDDALAIALACFSDLQIVGITTVYGNSTVQNSTRNALTILEVLGKKIPVYQGRSKPLKGRGVKATSHGENGLGGFSKELSSKKERASAEIFLESLLEQSNNKSVTVVCMGPSTNIASLAISRPELVEKIKEIIILGGVFNEKGNITADAEFNVINDPYALRKILSLNCNKILIPINVCRKVFFTQKDFDTIQNPRLRKTFKTIADIFIRYYTSDKTFGGFKGGVMYDLLTIAYLIKPSLFSVKPANVQVSVRKKDFGKTEIKPGDTTNCLVVNEVDETELKNVFFNTING